MWFKVGSYLYIHFPKTLFLMSRVIFIGHSNYLNWVWLHYWRVVPIFTNCIGVGSRVFVWTILGFIVAFIGTDSAVGAGVAYIIFIAALRAVNSIFLWWIHFIWFVGCILHWYLFWWKVALEILNSFRRASNVYALNGGKGSDGAGFLRSLMIYVAAYADDIPVILVWVAKQSTMSDIWSAQILDTE